jgi:hypothetical protein
MPASIPVALRLQELLHSTQPAHTLTLEGLRTEIKNLIALQRTAELMNEMAYMDAILAHAPMTTAKASSLGRQWSQCIVVRPALLRLLARRLELCQAELAARLLKYH